MDAASNLHPLSDPMADSAADQRRQRIKQPDRLNFAGCCVHCGERDCKQARCLRHHRVAEWQVCYFCDGSGFDKTTSNLCDCHGGLLNMAYSDPCPRPRPARLTFAGYCLWCRRRWCTSERCIDRHARSTWSLCPTCRGRGCQDFDIGGCAYGLVEVDPNPGARGDRR